MFPACLLLALAGCRCNDGAPQEIVLPDAEPTGLQTTFRGAPQWVPTPEEAFAIRDRCPRVERVVITRQSDSVRLVELWGEHLDRVDHVGVSLPGGAVAESRHVLRDDGSLAFPLASPEGTVFLGLALPDGRLGACTGVGRSLEVRGGRVANTGS